MPVLHKNKAFATLLAATLGAIGVHHLYLYGLRDKHHRFFIYLQCITVAACLYLVYPNANWFYWVLPILVAAIAGMIEALAIGLQSDEKWDAKHNSNSGKTSNSSGWLALVLVATLGAGAVLTIGTISRLFDLLYTGGAYG